MAALETLIAVYSGAYADVALERAFKTHSLPLRDRGLTTELAYGSIRMRNFLDCWVDYFAKIPSIKQTPIVRWILHLGLYQILRMNKIPPSAAINTSVELTKTKKLRSLTPFVNGLLRSALRAKEEGFTPPISLDPIKQISILESLPDWLANDLILWEGKKKALQLARSFNALPSFDLRVNKLRSNRDEVQELFDKQGFKTDLIKTCPYGLQILESRGSVKSWPGYEEGYWSVQDRSSQWVAPLLNPQTDNKVLDACAAPGGKTTHLYELMEGTGELWAIDRSESRIKLVEENANRLGCHTLNIFKSDSSLLLDQKPSWREYFHRILLDAPCSGLGTLARHPDARWKMSRIKINELVFLQSYLLERLLPLLRKDGRLVYSTCTINPKENFVQIQDFLSSHPELELIYENQIWPDSCQSGDGFYAAIIEYKS